MHSLNEPRSSNLPSIQMKKKKREFSEGKNIWSWLHFLNWSQEGTQTMF